jgi:hypothetical protein
MVVAAAGGAFLSAAPRHMGINFFCPMADKNLTAATLEVSKMAVDF